LLIWPLKAQSLSRDGICSRWVRSSPVWTAGQGIQIGNQEKTMTSVAKLALLAALAAGIASPALARSDAHSSSAKVRAHDIRAYDSGRLFDMAAPSAPKHAADTPSATGGGSTGYNQMLYNW